MGIRVPTAAAVSTNGYTRPDVGGEGALNNSRKGAPTRIGGWISGKPELQDRVFRGVNVGRRRITVGAAVSSPHTPRNGKPVS